MTDLRRRESAYADAALTPTRDPGDAGNGRRADVGLAAEHPMGERHPLAPHGRAAGDAMGPEPGRPVLHALGAAVHALSRAEPHRPANARAEHAFDPGDLQADGHAAGDGDLLAPARLPPRGGG